MGSCACSLAMNTSNPNASECQSQCCCCTGDGGAASLSSAINAVGKWGTVLLGTAQGKPVSTGKTQIGAKGATALPGNMNGTMLLLILVVIAAFFFILRK